MPVEDIAYSVFEQLAQQLPEQFVVGVNSRQIQEQILESVALPDAKPSFFGANYLKKDNPESTDIIWIMRRTRKHPDKQKRQPIFVVGWWKANGDFGGIEKVIWYDSEGKKRVNDYSAWNWRGSLIQSHYGRYPPLPSQFRDWSWFSKAFGKVLTPGYEGNPWESSQVKFLTVAVGNLDYPKVLNWSNDTLQEIFK